MEAQLDRITRQVEGEVSCLRDLVELLDQEKDILLGGRHQELMGAAERKLSLLHQLRQTQEERRRAQMEMAPEGGEAPSLRQISRLLPAPRQGEFRQALVTADGLAKRVMSASAANQAYLQEALATVDHLLHLLSGGGANQGGYSPRGTAAAPNRARLLAREV